MSDLILLQLKKFEDAVSELPTRDDVISEILSILDDNDKKSVSLNEGKKLLNEFMGYVVKISRVKAQAAEESDREFTIDQIKSIIEIDGLFQTYLEDNFIVARHKRAANNNAQKVTDKEEQLISSITHAFDFSSDRFQRDTAYNEYMKIKIALPNFTDYQPIFDRIIEIDIEAFIDTMSFEEILEIDHLSNDFPHKESVSFRDTLNISITLPKL